MTPETRIAALERQLFDKEQEMIETRNAAVSIISGILEGVIKDPAARTELAEEIIQAGRQDGSPAMVRLTVLVAAHLRGGGERDLSDGRH